MTTQDIEDIIYLIRSSDYHNWWGREYFIDLIKTPFSLKQYIVLRDGHVPISFATWGFPSPEHVKEYLLDHKFPAEGFYGGGKDPWLVDFIAVGGMRNTTTGFRSVKNVLSNMGYSQAYWFRTETNKLGFHKLNGVSDGRRTKKS
jgi:hemolysin-activating ACP:hemolysin acyltransferase